MININSDVDLFAIDCQKCLIGFIPIVATLF